MLSQYCVLLMRWNSVHNLTAIESPTDVLIRHLLDSLAIVPELQSISGEHAVNVLDVGAGGGLPGVPLAIAAPNFHVTLIDKVSKKIAFLTQVKLELALRNIECIHSRVETWEPAQPFKVIVARAFASLPELVRLTRHLLAERGWWCAMKGALPNAEIEALKIAAPDVNIVSEIRLRVPHLDAERHLILMQVAEG